jgi:glycosyltransferase involved in cell wall biosynthesis
MLAYAHYVNDARIKSYVRTLEDDGHDVDVIALRADGESAVEGRPTGTIFRLMSKYQGKSSLMYLWCYLRFFVKSSFLLVGGGFYRRYDVVHVHNMPNALVFAAFGPKMLGARLILDVHDLMTVNYMAKFNALENDLAVRILKIEQQLSAMFVDRVFCADHNQQDYLVEYCGVARQKITVLMNLPNAGLFNSLAMKKDKDTEVFRIVYHGTIAHRLGIDLILKAVAKVTDCIPAELWIYGAGDYLSEMIALASELNLEHKVHFSRTFFPVEQIPEIVAPMDLGIIANRRNVACDKYMLPVKLLEYVYMGVPVVAPRLDIIARYFDDSMVRYYEPENIEQMAKSILDLFNDKNERKRLARTASLFYQKHDIRAQAECYLNLLAEFKVSPRPQPAKGHL